MIISFNFSYLESFFVVLFLSLHFILAPHASARHYCYWERLLDRITVGRTELPNGPMHVRDDSQETSPPLNGAASCPS